MIVICNPSLSGSNRQQLCSSSWCHPDNPRHADVGDGESGGATVHQHHDYGYDYGYDYDYDDDDYYSYYSYYYYSYYSY